MSSEVWQVLLIIISPIGALLGAYAFRLKIRAEADAAQARAHAKRVEVDANARIKQIELDAQVRLKEAENEAEKNKAEADQAKQLLDIVSKGLNRVSDAVEGSTKAYQATVDKLFERLDKKDDQISEDQVYVNERLERALNVMEALPEKIQVDNAAFVKQFSVEFGLVLGRQLAVQDFNHDLLRWPSDDDPSWKSVFLKPTKPDVILYRFPSYDDFNHVQKPCARMKPEGQQAEIIMDRLQDWMYVKKRNGEACYGFLPVGSVKVTDARSQPEVTH